MAKKVPSGHLHDPSALLLADTTHCVQVLAEVQLAHPVAQGVHTPLLS